MSISSPPDDSGTPSVPRSTSVLLTLSRSI